MWIIIVSKVIYLVVHWVEWIQSYLRLVRMYIDPFTTSNCRNVDFSCAFLMIPHWIVTFIKVMSFLIAIKSEYGKLDTLFRKLAANAASEGS